MTVGAVRDPAAGAQAATRFDALAEDERRFLALLRDWFCGPRGQQAAWRRLSGALGPAQARALLGALEAWFGALAEAATRKLHRHCPGCPFVGRDEALLTGMVSAAGRGDLDVARALAREIARPDAAPMLAVHARALGLAVLQAEAAPGGDRVTLH